MLHLAAAQRCLQRQRLQQLSGRGRHQDRQVGHRSTSRATRVRLHALHLSDRLHPGKEVDQNLALSVLGWMFFHQMSFC